MTKKPLWRRILLWTSIIFSSLLLLVILAVVGILLYLTPERLTTIVNDYASDYLKADVRAERVELTFWSTFPRLNVDVTNLTIVSRSLDNLTPEQRSLLPADADSLLSLEAMSGGIHVMKLIGGDFELYDLRLKNPKVNLVVYNNSITNYDIVPPSEETSNEPLPPISINRFALQGSMPVRYRVPADSIDVSLTLLATEIKGKDAPVYRLDFNGLTGTTIGDFTIPPLPFSINGNVHWDQRNASSLGLTDFEFESLGIKLLMNAQLDFSEDLLVNSANIAIPEIAMRHIRKIAPEEYKPLLEDIDTDLSVRLSAKLLEPYKPAMGTLPRIDVAIEAMASRLLYQSMQLSRLNMVLKAMVDLDNLDHTTIDLEQLQVVGRAMNFDLTAKINTPISDANVEATFSGNLNLSKLPRNLMSKLPCTIAGQLHGDADMRFKLSQLTPKKLHKVWLDGRLTLSNFAMAMQDNSCDAYLRSGELRLGSKSSRSIANQVVDSLFTASMKVDTMSFNAPGLHFAGRDMLLAMGSKNVASSTDTTQINPIGGVMKAQRLSLNADSADTRILLQDIAIHGSLKRYNDQRRQPLLSLNLSADRIRYADTDMRATLRQGEASLELHPRTRTNNHRVDSLRRLYPGVSDDSLRTMNHKNRGSITQSDRENIDFGVDNSLKEWLRKWQLHGDVKASRARVYMNQFPIRNRLTDLDLCVSTDSVIVHSAKLRSGKSDFEISGAIRNINRALTSRRGSPIEIDMSLHSDTIDINDLTAALLRGAAASQAAVSGVTVDLADDDDIDRLLDQADNDTEDALVIPSNVNAHLNVNARHVLYGDLWLNRLRGSVSIYDGAINLDRLKASTDMGSVDFSGLYSAPTRRDINFAAGMTIKKLKLNKFLETMPQLDSIMPILKEMDGVIDAQMAITTRLDSMMNIDMSSLDMALRLSGDSLVLMDSETFRTVSKWLMFKNKQRNMIDHMDVEVTVKDGWLNLYPVVFDMDRYRLGVTGNNDMDFNLDYHVAVFKSPIPFKFGINIKGTPEKMKIRLGKARLNEKSVASRNLVADSIRVNLLQQMRSAFNRGIKRSGSAGLRLGSSRQKPLDMAEPAGTDDENFNYADSVLLIKEGLMERPEGFVMPEDEQKSTKKKKKKK